jgi:uncharacterized small protein (DUF1192 family)
MAWNDRVFRDIVARRATEIGKSQAQVLSEAGVSKNWFSPSDGRRIVTLERLLAPLEWEPDDLFAAISAAFGWEASATIRELEERIKYHDAEIEILKRELAKETYGRLIANSLIAYVRLTAPAAIEDMLSSSIQDTLIENANADMVALITASKKPG